MDNKGQISIIEIIQVRVTLSDINDPTQELTAALKVFDQIIHNFAMSLAPKETLQ